ncbi:MAG: hypothetical protein IJR14_08650, partial [Synergistaceae bacterium]|nr:hypothetical protein [Synergistaceae bacterium]
GFSELHLTRVMRGSRRGCVEIWGAVCKVLGVDAPPPPDTPSMRERRWDDDAGRCARRVHVRIDIDLPPPPTYTFTPKTRYVIHDGPSRDRSFWRPLTVTYLRKEGQHHVFRGGQGWLTTWTDAQLVGKRVTSA